MTDLIAIRRELARLRDQVNYIERTLPAIRTSLQLIEQSLDTEPQPAPRGSFFDEIVQKPTVRTFGERLKTGDVPLKSSVVDQNIDDPTAGQGYNGEKALPADRQFLRDAKAKAVALEVMQPKPAEPLVETSEWTQTMNLLLNSTENVFVTGGGGVGKSTMLEQVVEHFAGNLAVVAPTGTAALKVGGSTIHKMFKFGAHAIDDDDVRRLEYDKRRIYEKLDALLVDEVSMCRADLMDGIDLFLRKNRGNDKPFGGVRLLLFGDPFQLPPVVKEKDEKRWLKTRYGTEMPFFFHSRSLRDNQPKICELTHVFRQKDEQFIHALNAMRKGTITPEQIASFNARMQPAFKPELDDLWITLTTTNSAADLANQAMLRTLPGEAKTFQAVVTGDFDMKNPPTDESLQLKVGTSVLFVRNDNRNHYWVNGTLGKVTRLDPLWVKTESGEHLVEPESWETIGYTLDEKTGKLKRDIKGKFQQVPLRHAAAITIHRSQGASMDKVIIDLAGGAFASGQAYVAFSRCRLLDGIVLRRPLRTEDIMVDEQVQAFMAGKAIARPEPAQTLLLPEDAS